MPECRKCGSDDIAKRMLDNCDYLCRKCDKEQSRKRYLENREVYLERAKDNYQPVVDYASKEWCQRYLAQMRYRDRKRCLGSICDLTVEQLQIIIQEPCFYCEDEIDNRGLDRIDNDNGHTLDNVVACCSMCNSTRMAQFTHKEMKMIGLTVKKIKENRRL